MISEINRELIPLNSAGAVEDNKWTQGASTFATYL